MRHDMPPTATLCHGPWGGPYRHQSVPIRRTDAPQFAHTRSGYGTKIPTDRMIRYEKRWRRVYYTVHSNIGTSYVLIDKTPTIVDLDHG